MLAVALCEGPITGIGRVWADGKLMSLDGVTMRVHLGDEDQAPNPFIAAKMGEANTPAYRGTAYVFFEALPLDRFGNRLPQLSFEVFRPILDDTSAESLVRAVTLIPASGEFAYATDVVRREVGDDTAPENVKAEADRADIVVALDRLEACAPKVESVSLVVAWFGDDLRAGHCRIRPGVEVSAKTTTPDNWSVDGVDRGSAHLVSRDTEDRPAYGGTPSDSAVVQAIHELKARGYRVTFYPFILMEVPADNTLPDPYSEHAASAGQPSYPWRGRITCSPAAGYAGSPEKTVAAGAQVAAFFGDAQSSDFDVDGDSVAWDGDPDDWGLRRMILHYAHLCAAAGGVDAFLIGSELHGITQGRSGASSYPAVGEFVDLAADVRSILGSGTQLGYVADWSEYFGRHPQGGSGDVFVHLDPLWADGEIDFVGIDNSMPLLRLARRARSLRRSGLRCNHRPRLPARQRRGRRGLRTGSTPAPPTARRRCGRRSPMAHMGGRGCSGTRTSGADGRTLTATGRAGSRAARRRRGRRRASRSASPRSAARRPIGARTSRTSSTTRRQPRASCGISRAAGATRRSKRRFLEAALGYWAEPSNNSTSGVYSGRMITTAETAAWTWDARPFPAFPARSDVWTDADNWRLGHWLNGRLGSVLLRSLIRELCRRAGLPHSEIDASALVDVVHGHLISAIESPRASLAPLAWQFGFDAIESEGVIRFQPRDRRPVATLILMTSRSGSVPMAR